MSVGPIQQDTMSAEVSYSFGDRMGVHRNIRVSLFQTVCIAYQAQSLSVRQTLGIISTVEMRDNEFGGAASPLPETDGRLSDTSYVPWSLHAGHANELCTPHTWCR